MDANYFRKEGESIGAAKGEARNQLEAMREIVRESLQNPFNSIAGVDPGATMIPILESADGLLEVPDEVNIEASFSKTLSTSVSSKISPGKAVEGYNSRRRSLNKEYRDRRRAFVQAWSDVVVPVQDSSLGV